MKKIKILHLAPHVGAGVGTVVFSLLRQAKENPELSHELCILGYADERALEAQKTIGFALHEKMASDHEGLLTRIKRADAVLIHWWNHPLLSDFLIRQTLPPTRIAIWCHISGSLAPNNLTDKILRYPDVFVFTTPLSYETSEVLGLPIAERKRLRDIWSTGGVEHLKTIKQQGHEGFHVGYVGNVGHGKMHPDFLDLSNQIGVPDIRFTVIGGHNHKKMEAEAKDRGIAEKFAFPGFVPEKEKWELLSTFDVFGYPLSADHYGSCDQVLQEAMVVGAVPVVFANPMESLIVKHGVTGLVAKTPKDYARAIETLYRDRDLREGLAKNARQHALRRFSLKRMTTDWEKILYGLLQRPRASRAWPLTVATSEITPADIFIESLGGAGEPFKSFITARTKKEKVTATRKIKDLAKLPNWQSETKSTVHNFKNFLPPDPYLTEWSRIMRGKSNK